MRSTTKLIIAFCLSVSFSLTAIAEESAEAAPEMSAEEQAMMAAWAKAATPGEEHARLANLAGDWSATVTYWTAPGDEPNVSESSVQRRMSLDGRVLEDHWSGNMMGQSFKGRGRTGYDNVTEKWWSTWSDNMSTGVMVSYGHWDEEAQAFVYHGEYVDPVSGETVPTRTVISHPDADTEVIVMYENRGGDEVKTMEIKASRNQGG